MEEHTTTTTVLTIDQCQCLIQIWEKITYGLVFSGQHTTLCQALRGARSVLNSDEVTVSNAQNQLARIFANLSVAKIEQLTLSHLTTVISGARIITTPTNPQNIDTGYLNIDHGPNTDLSAGTDRSHATSMCLTNLLPKSDRPVHVCDDSEEDTVTGQHSSFTEPEKSMLASTRNHSPALEPDQVERGNGTDNSGNDEYNNVQFDEYGITRPARRQKLSLSSSGTTTRKHKYLLQQTSGGPSKLSRLPKPRRRSGKSRSPLDKETEVGVGPTFPQSGMSTTSSVPESQHHQHQTRRGADQSSGTPVDDRLVSTAGTTPAAPESAPLTDPAVAAQVDADLDWEVRGVLGKKEVDGEVQYLVDWRPTMVPEHALRNAKEMVDEFEAQVRAQRESKSGQGRPVSLNQGEQVMVVAGTPQKRPRG